MDSDVGDSSFHNSSQSDDSWEADSKESTEDRDTQEPGGKESFEDSDPQESGGKESFEDSATSDAGCASNLGLDFPAAAVPQVLTMLFWRRSAANILYQPVWHYSSTECCAYSTSMRLISQLLCWRSAVMTFSECHAYLCCAGGHPLAFLTMTNKRT